MTNYEMVERLSEKMNVSLEEAKAALEASDWEMLDAALLLEKERGERQDTYSTQAADAQDDEKKGGKKRGLSMNGIGQAITKLINCGARNRFEVRRGEEMVMELPVLALVLLMLFAFWVCLPLLVIGLFAGYRYSFSGAELGRESVNNVMNKAAEAAEKVKEEVTGER